MCHVDAGACRTKKRVLDSLKRELTGNCEGRDWVLGIKLGSSGRAASTLLTAESSFQSPQKGLELNIRHTQKALCHQDFSNDILTGH